jgi:tRNA U34 5-methylaminomethyl-2-thiouridine-forming methyltransferase MnmC
MQNGEDFQPQLTADGSFTFFSTEFDEAFHSRQGARLEADLKFIQPTQLALKAQQPTVAILDVCYGLGYNTAAALETVWAINPGCQVKWIGLESDLTVPRAAIAHNLLSSWTEPIPQLLKTIATELEVKSDRLHARLLLGDARQTIQQVHQAGFRADAIFLDPFSPPHCPQLWTVDFLAQVAGCLKPDGKLATYSCAAAVRTALIHAGLQVSSTPEVGRRSPGTLASFTPLASLSIQDQEHLQTRAAVPYRDPTLTAPAAEILRQRQIEQQICSLESTSQWKKRWMGKDGEISGKEITG